MTTPDDSYPPPGSYPPGPGVPASGSAQQPGLRASDADRDRILSQLSEHFQAGRLTTAEFDERSSKALGARTMGDLAELTTDLPAAPGSSVPAGTPAPAQPPARQRGLGFPVAGAVLAVLAVVAVIAVLSHTGHHGAGGGWGFIIPALIILRIFAGRRGNRRGRG
ncbi:MAG TPA: DUF1707 domain-containing protein [Streptosporangiaceae bacterium]|nr:DUF1707 domain-containing protein [Streptosporangiaceae bacterium]